MTKLTNPHIKIFGSNNTNDIQVFGSNAAGAPALISDTDSIQALVAWLEGWNTATLEGANRRLPVRQEVNAISYLVTYALAYINQAGGLIEWNVQREYYINGIAREVDGTRIYRSITDNNIGNALTDTGNWELLIDLAGLDTRITDIETDVSNLQSDVTALEVIDTEGQIVVGDNTGAPAALPVGTGYLYGDGVSPTYQALPDATDAIAGIARFATAQEEFNKNTATIVTPERLAESAKLAFHSVVNNTYPITVTLPSIDTALDGVASFQHGYNLLTPFLAANESRVGSSFLIYKDITNTVQNTYLQEDPTVDPNQADSNLTKVLFPSNVYSYNMEATTFVIRVRVVLETLASVAGNVVNIQIRLLRGDFNGNDSKIVDRVDIEVGDIGVGIAVPYTRFFSFTYVGGNTDPFVTDGIRLDIAKDSVLSTDAANIQINSVDIAISRNT